MYESHSGVEADTGGRGTRRQQEEKETLKIYTKPAYYIYGIELRRARGRMTQAQLAARMRDVLGFASQQNISNIESSRLPHRVDEYIIEGLKKAGLKVEIVPPEDGRG